MIAPEHATNCLFYLLYVNGNAKKVVFLLLLNRAKRKANIRPYAGFLKMKQCAVRK